MNSNWIALISVIKMASDHHPTQAEDALDAVLDMLGKNDSVRPILLKAKNLVSEGRTCSAYIEFDRAISVLQG